MSDYLADVSPDSHNQPVYVLVRCPICHEEIIDDLEEHKYSHDDPVATHIEQHTPADLGLDQYYFRPMADILIELHGLDREKEKAT